MCGIGGLYNLKDIEAVKRMCRAMHHRGPDDEGLYADGKVVLGVRRLSIIDVAGGHQPIHNEDESLWIVFNGEIYNYKEERKGLVAKGHRFSTNSDTEVILHLYEEHGEECIHHLRGMFAFALWDKKAEKLFLARDRLGIKPLYFAEKGGYFIFASEIKAILASGLVERKISPQAIHHFLSFYAIPTPYSIIAGIYSLPAAHAISLRSGETRVYQYWQLATGEEPNVEHRTTIEEPEVRARLRELLQESVRLRLMSEVPLGAFLSGGIDSSTIVGIMSQMMDRPVKTFSIGFGSEGREINELSFAKIVAKRFGTDHQELILKGRDVADDLDRIIWAIDQPTGDGVNSYFVSKAAREGVTVALSGLGGDELFAGYFHFRLLRDLARYDSYWQRAPQIIRKAATSFAYAMPQGIGNRKPLLLIKLLGDTEGSFPKRYQRVRILYPEAIKNKLYTAKFMAQLKECEPSEDYLDQFIKVEETDVIRKISRLELSSYTTNTLLRDMDAVSMAHSLEVRVPFLDHKLVEFAFSIPSSMKVNGLPPKRILIEAVKDVLPRETFDRKKMGFELPMSAWLHKELRPYVDDAFSPGSIVRRGLFRYEEMQKVYNEFFTGNSFYMKVWAFVVLELWIRQFIDQPNP